jgi:hypothetical protein
MNKGGIVFFASLVVSASAACSSGNHTPVADAGNQQVATCGGKVTVEDQGQKDCTTCTASTACSQSTPVEACCTWMNQATTALARSTNLHRFSAPNGASPAPDLSCLTSPGTMGSASMVTLTGYVWLFSTGVDSAGVTVTVYKEKNPNTDGSFDMSAPLGTYTTKMSDAADPTPTSWNSNCPNGCSYRQYTIPNIPTETPLIIETSDSGGGLWYTLYDYNIYFPNNLVENEGGTPTVHYDATAASVDDPNTVAGSLGYSVTGGVIAGEVHDCWTDPDQPGLGVRLSGATVGSSIQPSGGEKIYYSTSDESNPLLSDGSTSTSDLSLFAGINYSTGQPIRVTATGEDPANPGKLLMLGTYVVQVFPNAVTAISLRGRRPWQL